VLFEVERECGLKSVMTEVERESEWMLCNEDSTWREKKETETARGGRGPLYEWGDWPNLRSAATQCPLQYCPCKKNI
jgi:hypothetical protein